MAPHNCTEAKDNYTGDCKLLQASYILAGLAMMLNIRLSYSSAPYALIRFRLPENLFSVFVRRMASALELWCLPSMLLGNIIDLIQKLVDGGHQVRALKSARPYDIEGNNKKGSELNNKSGLLKNAADNLYHAAQKLEAAAKESSSTLNPLKTAAGDLKKKARDTSSSGLYSAANQLATDGQDGFETKAKTVITKFDAVTTEYRALMTQASEDQKKNLQVIAVDEAYTQLKNIYEGMLNLTKLAVKANELQTKATQSANAPSLSGPAQQLESKVKDLRDTAANVHANAQKVESQFETVKNTFNGLTDGQKPKVQNEFDALNGAYGHIRIHDKPWKFGWIIVPSIVTQWLNFLTYVILFFVYLMGGDQGHLTTFYWVIAISGVVFGINMTLIYSVDFFYIPVYIAGENSFPIITSFMHYLSTLIFGNRRKWDSDYLIVGIDIIVAILISFVAAAVWTVGYLCEIFGEGSTTVGDMKHIHPHGFGGNPSGHQISPFLMIVVGMGLVYAIYPGIAPGMIVPFYLIDKIEMVLLIATFFPPVIIAILRKQNQTGLPQISVEVLLNGHNTLLAGSIFFLTY